MYVGKRSFIHFIAPRNECRGAFVRVYSLHDAMGSIVNATLIRPLTNPAAVKELRIKTFSRALKKHLEELPVWLVGICS